MTEQAAVIISSIVGGVSGALGSLVVEFFKNKTKYREPQLSLYLRLWQSLDSLKSSADRLWDKADADNLIDFIEQLVSTEQVINQNSILIEERHLNQLIELMSSFKDFNIGKTKLMDLRIRQSSRNIDESLIKELVDSNDRTRRRYYDLIKLVELSFRRQLRAS